MKALQVPRAERSSWFIYQWHTCNHTGCCIKHYPEHMWHTSLFPWILYNFTFWQILEENFEKKTNKKACQISSALTLQGVVWRFKICKVTLSRRERRKSSNWYVKALDHCRITIKLSLWCSTALPEVISTLSGRCILPARDLWLLLVGLMKDLCLSLFQFISILPYPALSALGLTSVIGLCAYLHIVIKCWGKTERRSLRSFIKMQACC